MTLNRRIRPADPSEGPFLTELTVRSKAHWGYGEAFMTTAARELEFHAEKFHALNWTTPEWGSAACFASMPARLNYTTCLWIRSILGMGTEKGSGFLL